MDLNEVPIDPMLNVLKTEEKKVGNFDDVVDMDLGCSKIKNDVDQRCKEVEDECSVLQLEIRSKEMNLEAIKDKIRVLCDEKRGIEEDIKGLKRRKAALEGVEVDGMMDTVVSSNESDEMSRVDQLLVENKVLECEKTAAVKEVEVLKRKWKELELLLELGGKLKCQGKDDVSELLENHVALNGDNFCASRKFGSLSSLTGAIGSGLPVEGIPDKEVFTEDAPINKVHVKKQLTYQTDRCFDKKFAPPTPVEKNLPSASVIDIIDSDNEDDTHVSHRPYPQRGKNSCMMSESDVPETDGTVSGVNYGKEQCGSMEDAPSMLTPRTKRKRDLMVVTSDDECEDLECTPNRRSLKIENSDNDGEDDDDNNLTRRRVSNRITNDSESDYDDDIPISQLKKKRAHQGSSQPVGTLNPTRPRRRLVKCGHSEQKDKAQDSDNRCDMLETENAANDESSEEDSENSARSLSSFIVDDEYEEDVEHDEDAEDDEDVEDAVSKGDAGDDSFGLQETSDDNLDYEEILSKLQSRRHPNSKWISEGDMLSDFGKNPELCLRAVCALYRQQTNEEKACKASLIPNRRGFSKFDATRGTRLGEFLTDGDPNGDLVKSVEELQVHHPDGVEECRRLADHYSKQLFKIYDTGEDPFFP